jgi:hypothetical protein
MGYKKYDFVYEREIRLICENNNEIFFRISNGLIVPYKKIYIDIKHLKEIMIGPAIDSDRMKFSIELLLRQRGIKGVKVTKSSAPLRNK